MHDDTQPVRIGWLSLALSVVVVCMAVLAVLSFTTARADFMLAQRYANTRTAMYEQEIKGQALLAQTDALRAQGLSVQEICARLGTVAQAQTADTMVVTLDDAQGNRLLIRMTVSAQSIRVTAWKHSAVWQKAEGELLWGAKRA